MVCFIKVLNGFLSIFTAVSAGVQAKKTNAGAPYSANIINDTNVVHLDPQYFPKYHSERVKISYGPYTAPSNTNNSGMWSYFDVNITMPCSDCVITWMRGGLEYPNGTYANSNTGMWLHHVVIFNGGRASTTCGTSAGWLSRDRFFASGNERTPVDLCVNGTQKAGYYLKSNDYLAMVVELMNETPDPREAVVTITYEYISSVPQTFKPVTSIWLDIDSNCTSNSEMPAMANSSFEYSMEPPWTADFSGEINLIWGHLHDGGTHLEVLKNDNILSECVAAYGESPGYIEMASDESMNMSMSMDMDMEMVHISSITCNPKQSFLNIGDELSVQAFYNTTDYSPMLNSDGTLAPIMGISILYVATSSEWFYYDEK
ncbi:MAG: hypothetical protein M1834_003260 [Cirrosporium novae-zelandiae]|nr:MAG: hypothetical protein M1834_003260 [Cirrosporium novae-zelandiae]